MYKDEIARGVAVLDEYDPGWEREVDLYTLDIANGEQCILAQVYWNRGKPEPDAIYERAGRTLEYFGFDMSHDEVDGDDDPNKTITNEWRQFIQSRLQTTTGDN